MINHVRRTEHTWARSGELAEGTLQGLNEVCFIAMKWARLEAVSFVAVPREAWASRRESPIVSLFRAKGTLLRKP